MRFKIITWIAALCAGMLIVPANAAGTQFTYQGELVQNGSLANGSYDMQFSLWNSQEGGTQIGAAIFLNNVPVADGKFMVMLDFGADALQAGQRWLQIGVDAATLSPRQLLTATPYAAQMRGLHVDAAQNVGVGTNVPQSKLDVNGRVRSYGADASVSVRNPTNDAASVTLGWLDNVARLRIGGNGAGANAGLDIQGLGDASMLRILNNGNVGIGTTAPNYDLQIVGNGSQSAMRITNGGTSATQNNTGLIIGDVTGAGRAASLYGVTSTDLLRTHNDGSGHALQVISGGSGNAIDVTESGGGIAVRAINNGTTGSAYGLFAFSNSSSGIGAYGQGKLGMYGFSAIGGFDGKGVYGVCSATHGVGVHGHATNGDDSAGVWGTNSGGGWAGFFSGNVRVTGTLLANSKNFIIDNPLNPSEEYLVHASIESDAMRNLYDGTVALDANGEAVVELPAWFEALNGDFRYQLTCIGGHAPVYVGSEISNNTFTIAGGTPGLKVSWQVTGVRVDPAASSAGFQVIKRKPASERGTYLCPEGYGQPASARARLINNAPGRLEAAAHESEVTE